MVKAVNLGYKLPEESILNLSRLNVVSYLSGGFEPEFLATVEKIFDCALAELFCRQHNPNLSLTATMWVDCDTDVTEDEILHKVDPRSIIERPPLKTFTVGPQDYVGQIKNVKLLAVRALEQLFKANCLPIRVIVELKADNLSYGTYYAGAWGKYGAL